MAKIIDETKTKSKGTIDRADYEYLRDETFYNTAIIVASISIYAIIAYPIACFLTSKTKE